MNATDAMGEGERTEGKPSPEDGAADGVRFVRNRADKDSRARFSLGRAFSCAWEGVVYTARTQRNMKIHFAVGAAAVLLGAAPRPYAFAAFASRFAQASRISASRFSMTSASSSSMWS